MGGRAKLRGQGAPVVRFLALVDRYLCHAEATQICARILLEEIASRGHSVTVVTIGDVDAVSEVDGVVVREVVPYTYAPTNFRRLPESVPRKALRRLMLIPRWIACVQNGYRSMQPVLGRRFFARVMEACEGPSCDALISFSSSFATHEVASKVRKRLGRSIFWIAYEMDPFALNYTLPKRREDARRLLEEQVLQHADLIVMSDGILEENHRRNHLIQYEAKTITLCLPGADYSQNIQTHEGVAPGELEPGIAKRENRVVRLAYSGSFYPDIRRPEPLLDLLAGSDFDFTLEICGNATDDLLDAYPDLRDRVTIHGYLTQDESYRICERADVLLDIQNDIPNQIPSKLFLYMSTGKPIVCLYRNGCDIGVGYLRDYPDALLIEKATVAAGETQSAFREFCLKRRSDVPADELGPLLRRYSTPVLVDKLLEAVKLKGLGFGCSDFGERGGRWTP